MNTKQLGDLIHPILKSAGFERKGSTWNRISGDFIDVVNLQRSQWSPRVTLNIGIVSSFIYKIRWGKDKKNFTETDCVEQRRIGDLFANRDIWWDLEDDKTPQELISAIEKYLFPYFNSLHDYDSLIDHRIKEIRKHSRKFDGISWEIAILNYLRGDIDKSRKMFEVILSEPKNVFSDVIEAMYQRLFGN